MSDYSIMICKFNDRMKMGSDESSRSSEIKPLSHWVFNDKKTSCPNIQSSYFIMSTIGRYEVTKWNMTKWNGEVKSLDDRMSYWKFEFLKNDKDK